MNAFHEEPDTLTACRGPIGWPEPGDEKIELWTPVLFRDWLSAGTLEAVLRGGHYTVDQARALRALKVDEEITFPRPSCIWSSFDSGRCSFRRGK